MDEAQTCSEKLDRMTAVVLRLIHQTDMLLRVEDASKMSQVGLKASLLEDAVNELRGLLDDNGVRL